MCITISQTNQYLLEGINLCGKTVTSSIGIKCLAKLILSITSFVEPFFGPSEGLSTFIQALKGTGNMINMGNCIHQIGVLLTNHDRPWIDIISTIAIILLGIRSTLSFLEKCGVQTLSRITATIGGVPVVGLTFSLLGFGLTIKSLYTAVCSVIEKQFTLHTSQQQLELWQIKQAAFAALKENESESVLEDLSMRFHVILDTENDETTKPKIVAQWKQFLEDIQHAKKVEDTEDLHPSTKTMEYFEAKLAYNVTKWNTIVYNDSVDKSKKIWSVTKAVSETVLGILVIISLVTGAAVLSATGLPMLVIVFIASGIGLSKYMHSLKHENPKEWEPLPEIVARINNLRMIELTCGKELQFVS